MANTVLVVGVGRFGAHYARILAGLNADRAANVAPIDRLVLTKTRKEPALRLAEQVRRDPACTVSEVVGVPVADDRQLVSTLKRFDPSLTCITATSPDVGDALHAAYAKLVLDHGSGGLLCEKPLSPTRGDGASLSVVQQLRRTGGSARFGLELPMAVVLRQMAAHPDLGPRLAQARRLEFFWSTIAPVGSDLVDALALHPWSLIPERLVSDRLARRTGAGGCDIEGRLKDATTGRSVSLRISLRTGSNHRSVAVDGFCCTFSGSGTQVAVTSGGPAQSETADRRSPKAALLVAVDNPLKQNIVASLAGAPTVGLSRTAQAQRFLEMAKGWPAG